MSKQNAFGLGYGKGFLEISSNVEPSCQCSLFNDFHNII